MTKVYKQSYELLKDYDILYYSSHSEDKKQKAKEDLVGYCKNYFDSFFKFIYDTKRNSGGLLDSDYKILSSIAKESNISLEDFIGFIVQYAEKRELETFFGCLNSILEKNLMNPKDLGKALINMENEGLMLDVAIQTDSKNLPDTIKFEFFEFSLKKKNLDMILLYIAGLKNIPENLIISAINVFKQEEQKEQKETLFHLTEIFFKKKDPQELCFYLKQVPKVHNYYLETAFNHFVKNGIPFNNLIDTFIEMRSVPYCSLALKNAPDLSLERVYKLVSIVVESFGLDDFTANTIINRVTNMIVNNIISQQNLDNIWTEVFKIGLQSEVALINEGNKKFNK